MTDTRTPVADALAVVDDNRRELLTAMGHYAGEGDVSSERDAYLGALENLADAVRSHGIGAELGQLRERRNMAPPVPGFTRPLPPYTVRAVLPRYDAEGRHLGWYIAADNSCGEWITWRAWEGEGGVLMCDQPHTISGPGCDVARHRAAALAELAERARLAYAPPF